jgi:hypothetical protein
VKMVCESRPSPQTSNGRRQDFEQSSAMGLQFWIEK